MKIRQKAGRSYGIVKNYVFLFDASVMIQLAKDVTMCVAAP